VADKLYGIWYQNSNCGPEGWMTISGSQGLVLFSSCDIRLARAHAIKYRADKDLSVVNYVVCEIGDDGRPFNCDEELWEI